MKKVLIIGCGGAGKSTLAKKMGLLTGLPVIHLDQYYWKANWVASTPSEWEKRVQQLVQQPAWIMDGNYGGTMDSRIAQADTLIFLDYPSWLCLLRVLKRTVRYWRQTRPEMTAGCQERFSWPFLHYIAIYNRKRKPGILAKLNALTNQKTVVILKNKHQVKNFLDQLSSKKTISNE
jgi:adenylate kinase family enzyme